MATRSITTKLPSGSQAYVFGSYLFVGEPRDIDILILYDPTLSDPKAAYKVHCEFVDEIQQLTGTPVDLTLLTYSEEKNSDFIGDTGAVPITDVGGKLTRRCSGAAR